MIDVSSGHILFYSTWYRSRKHQTDRAPRTDPYPTADARAALSLATALGDADHATRSNAAGALVMLGEPAVLPLAQALQHSDQKARREAAWALGEIAERAPVSELRTAVPTLRRLLRWWWIDPGQKEGYRRVLARIEEVTGPMRGLFRPAPSPSSAPEWRVVPAESPEAEEDDSAQPS